MKSMKRMACAVVAFLILLTAVVPVSGWGKEGHSTVGQIASQLIKPHTRGEIRKILKPGETLASIANWADEIKSPNGELMQDPDTREFLGEDKNKQHPIWHFDDLPLMCVSYDQCNGFTPDTDVVHMINICIRTLQGNSSPDHPLSKRNALRWLVHLVGDLHQPLHVGSGYVDLKPAIHIATDPQMIAQHHLDKDVGGNLLILNQSDRDTDNLHSFWDTQLVRSAMSNAHVSSPTAFADLLKDKGESLAGKPSGPINTWAAQWAGDSLTVSRQHAYDTVQITGQRTIMVKDRKTSKLVPKIIFDITFKTTYDVDNRSVVRDQIAKGGYRLAALLDAIFSSGA